MQKQLTLAIIQADLVWQNAGQNRVQFSEKMNQIAERVDVIVLPEMFTTGFSMQPKEIAETMQGETVNWMLKKAAEKNAAIAGSIIISENGKYYNRFLFVHPSGEIDFYNKKHLFTLAGEHKIYTSGTEKRLVNYKGWTICPLVCYDLRFPVWARNTKEYDVLMYVANWPKPRITAWDTLLKARAIENMCYTVGVNRVGVDDNGMEYSGHSAVYDCLGEELTDIKPNCENVSIITIDKNHLTKVRNKLNFLGDMDVFEIKQ